jgi:hypothetical protein
MRAIANKIAILEAVIEFMRLWIASLALSSADAPLSFSKPDERVGLATARVAKTDERGRQNDKYSFLHVFTLRGE